MLYEVITCAERVAPRTYALLDDELGPLERLHADEHGAERGEGGQADGEKLQTGQVV